MSRCRVFDRWTAPGFARQPGTELPAAHADAGCRSVRRAGQVSARRRRAVSRCAGTKPAWRRLDTRGGSQRSRMVAGSSANVRPDCCRLFVLAAGEDCDDTITANGHIRPAALRDPLIRPVGHLLPLERGEGTLRRFLVSFELILLPCPLATRFGGRGLG